MGMCSLIRKDVINTLDTWLARATAPDDVHANAFSLAAPVENSSFKNRVMDVFLKNWRFQLVVYTCFKTSPHPTQLLRRMVRSRFAVKPQKYPVDQIFTWLSIHPSVEQIMSEFSFLGELILLIHLIVHRSALTPHHHCTLNEKVDSCYLTNRREHRMSSIYTARLQKPPCYLCSPVTPTQCPLSVSLDCLFCDILGFFVLWIFPNIACTCIRAPIHPCT